MSYLLSIHIPTIVGRETQFDKLYNDIKSQIFEWQLESLVECIFEKDNKEISIGKKRQKLYERSKGKFSWQIDDDDSIDSDAIINIVNYIRETDCDYIGSYERCNVDGLIFTTKHSNQFLDWCDYKAEGCVYGRTPFFKDPILTEYCLKVGVKDLRFGEDHDFARRMKESGLIQNEVFHEDILYYYRRISTPHNERYGIR